MIKKTYFVQLTLLIIFLFLLYQITSIRISFDDSAISNNNEVYVTNNEIIINKDSPTVLLITGKNNKATYIQQELNYLRKDYRVYDSIFAVSEKDLKDIEVIILSSDTMKDTYDLTTIQSCMKKGIHIVMAKLPREDELNKEWHSLLGIKSIKGTYDEEGITVFSGFFLGGKHNYEKLNIEAMNIKVSSTCKTYIAGYTSEERKQEIPQITNEDMPDILWRNVYRGSQIYVVNGSFFSSNKGIGIITSIFAQIYQDFIYPVINAKAIIVNNAPYLSQENDIEMKKRYARNSLRFFEDIALQDIIRLSLSTGNVPTLYAIKSLDGSSIVENELNTSILSNVNSELNRVGGEIGISTYDKEETIDTLNIYKKSLYDYNFNSLYLNDYNNNANKSIVDSVNEINKVNSLIGGITFSYYNDNIVNIPVITEGFHYTDENLFKLHSMTTGLGVIVHGIDMSQIIYPENEDDDWTNAYKNLSSSVDTFWADYKYLNGLNVSEVSNRVKRFLNIKPKITISNNSINIFIDNFNKESYFILRTKKKVTGIDHGNVTKIEDGAYLINANKENVEILLKD